MPQTWSRYAVFRIKKAGGLSEIVAIHDSWDAANSEVGELSDIRSPYRFSVMPVTITENPDGDPCARFRTSSHATT